MDSHRNPENVLPATMESQIRKTLRDVPVPPHLKIAVLSRVAAAASKRRRRRMRFPIAAAICLMLGLWVSGAFSPPHWSLDRVCDEAITIYEQLDHHAVDHSQMVASDYPYLFRSGRYRGLHQTRFLDIQVNAYEFSNGNGRLLVIALPRERFTRKHIEIPEKYSSTTNGVFVSLFPTREWVYLAVYDRAVDLNAFSTGRSMT